MKKLLLALVLSVPAFATWGTPAVSTNANGAGCNTAARRDDVFIPGAETPGTIPVGEFILKCVGS